MYFSHSKRYEERSTTSHQISVEAQFRRLDRELEKVEMGATIARQRLRRLKPTNIDSIEIAVHRCERLSRGIRDKMERFSWLGNGDKQDLAMELSRKLEVLMEEHEDLEGLLREE